MKQRLAAILAADAAGYSRLMAINDKATVATLDAARAVFSAQIEALQGRVIDMAGDSVLAVFGTVAGVVTAARVMSMAGPGVLGVSSTARDLVAGSGIGFEARGAHALKGVPGEWTLHRALVPVEG